MARLDSFLRIVAEQEASDLHFHAGNVPIIRYAGDLIEVPFRVLTPHETTRFLREILSREQAERLDTDKQLDLIYNLPGVGRFRGNIFTQNFGLSAVFRVIPTEVPTLESLGLPPILRKLTSLGNGLVIVTGPTGSGKTTTLAALVNEINRTSQRHIITIEDPVEFVHGPIKSVVTQREVGRHVESFASGLRSALREAPDVLVVGEMRDPETVALALAAAETGVLVFGTLHTNSAAKAVDRIIDAVPDDTREQARGLLSVLLRGVVSQHLVKRINADGRIAACAVLLQSTAVSNMIREGKTHQLEGHLETLSFDGSGARSLDHSLFELVRDGVIGIDDAMAVCDRPDQLRKLVAELPEEE